MRLLSEGHRSWLVYTACSLAALSLYTANLRGGVVAERLESIVLSIMAPYYNTVNYIGESASRVWKNYFALINLRKQNDIMETELTKSRCEVSELRERLSTIERYNKLYCVFPEHTSRRIIAAVIRRNRPTWDTVFMINVGELDGVKKFTGVASSGGVVGQVVETGPHISKIITLAHPRSGIAALLQKSRVSGIVTGTGTGKCTLKFAGRFDRVILGETVITSGLDGAFPKGLPIGRVSRIEKSPGEIFQKIEIIPFVDLPTVEEVVVFLSTTETSEHSEAKTEPEATPVMEAKATPHD